MKKQQGKAPAENKEVKKKTSGTRLLDRLATNKGAYTLITLAVLVIYLPTFFYGFSPLDERTVIFANKAHLSFSHLSYLFSHSTLNMYYRPMFMSSFIFDMVMSDGSPFAFHLINVVLHLICSILVLKLFAVLKQEPLVSLFGALLFAVHPLCMHAVAWIPGRNDSLLCLFVLLSTLQLFRYSESRKTIHLFAHLAFFVGALLTKENAIVLPLVYFMIIRFSSGNDKPKVAPLLASWFIAGTAWFFVRKSVVAYLPPIASSLSMKSLTNFISALIDYTGKAFVPVEQSVMPTLANTLMWPFVITTVIVILLTLKFGLKNKNIALFGIIWFYIFLLIPAWVGATDRNGEQYEHRAYTSLIGAVLFISQVKIPISTGLLRKLAVGVLLLFIVKSSVRRSVYADDRSFIEAGTVEAPSVAFFHDMLGFIYQKDKDYVKAVESYSRAIELDSTRAEYYNNRGSAYNELHDFKRAIADDNRVLQLDSLQKETYVNRSMAYYSSGDYERSKLDLIKAERLGAKVEPRFKQALALATFNVIIDSCSAQIKRDSTAFLPYNKRGNIRMKMGEFQMALDDFNKAVLLAPEVPQLKQNRDSAEVFLKRYPQQKQPQK